MVHSGYDIDDVCASKSPIISRSLVTISTTPPPGVAARAKTTSPLHVCACAHQKSGRRLRPSATHGMPTIDKLSIKKILICCHIFDIIFDNIVDN